MNIFYPEEMKQWFESHDFVKSADCQIFYLHEGYDNKGERTVGINKIITQDGEEWQSSPMRIGGDFRDDPSGLFMGTSKAIFNRRFGL